MSSITSDGIGGWVGRHAVRRPRATALVDAETGRRWTYPELELWTSSVAAGLKAHGLQQGDRVALLMDNSPEVLVLLIAAAKLGAVTVPVNFRLSADEVGYVVADSGARVLVVSERHAETGKVAAGGAVTLLTSLPSSDPLVSFPAVAGSDLCVIMYTSGTTGSPKGAMLTHDNMLWNAVNVSAATPGLSGDDVTIAVAPLFHIGALGLSALPMFYVGGTVVVQNGFDPALTFGRMRDFGVTTQFMVPAMWAAMTQVPGLASSPLPSLKQVTCGGAPCPIAVIEFFVAAGWTFIEGFGMTELAPAALRLDAADVLRKAGSVGRPFFHVDIRVVDETGADVPVGVVGELVLLGPNVFVGYWGRPEATADALRNGWFHSGDLGRLDDEGYLTLVDRKKDMIITGGENVYPIEVERALQLHPGVLDCAVVGVPDARWGETVVAVVVGTGVTPAELIAHTRGLIAHFKCPTRVELVAELPRNATGKLLKRQIRERLTGSGATVTR